MKKIIIILSIIIGFSLSILTGRLIATYNEKVIDTNSVIANGLCSGFPVDEKYNRNYTTGVPIKWNKQQTVMTNECTVVVSDSKIKNSITNMYLKSWQFYANGLIWSGSVYAVMHLLRNFNKKKIQSR